MATSFSAFDAIQPLDHALIEGSRYVLEDITDDFEKGTCIEAVHPISLVGTAPVDLKLEVQVSLGGTHRQDCLGILVSRKRHDDPERQIRLMVHGVTLGINPSTNGDTLNPGRLWESAPGGCIDEATDGLLARGKILEPIPPGKVGAITVF